MSASTDRAHGRPGRSQVRRLETGSPLRRAMVGAVLRWVDSLSLAVAFVAGGLLVFTNDAGSVQEFLDMRLSLVNVVLFFGLLVAFRLCFASLGLYETRRAMLAPQRLKRVVAACGLTVVVVAISTMAFDISIVTPLFLVAYGTLAVALTVSVRVVLRAGLLAFGREGTTIRRVLIIGSGPRARRYASGIADDPEERVSIVGFCDEDWPGIDEFHDAGYKRVTDPKNFRDFLRQEIVDEVVVAVPMSVLSRMERAVLPPCEEFGVTLHFLGAALQDVSVLSGRRVLSDNILLTVYHGDVRGWDRIAKRLLDVAIGSVLLVVLSPALAAIALAVKLDSRGPAIFAQVRVGRNKRLFRMYKFRTMHADAEQQMVELEHLNEADGPVFKIRNDPRVTRWGSWLRSTSLDELPQLVNVVLGQMSLVGPRPLPIRDAEAFSDDRQRRRFSVLPGLTGLWQVSGRSEVSFDEWMEMDQEYIDNWSLMLDLEILFRTIPEVVRRTGAY